MTTGHRGRAVPGFIQVYSKFSGLQVGKDEIKSFSLRSLSRNGMATHPLYHQCKPGLGPKQRMAMPYGFMVFILSMWLTGLEHSCRRKPGRRQPVVPVPALESSVRWSMRQAFWRSASRSVDQRPMESRVFVAFLDIFSRLAD